MNVSEFLPSEIVNIQRAKQVLMTRLVEFNITLAKLGSEYRNGYFVSGGCFASFLQQEEPKDIDIWFTHEDVAQRVIELYTNDPSYMNEVAVWDEKYRSAVKHPNGMMITENAVTLKNGIQLITKYYDTPKVVRSTFDYKHCMPYYDSRDDKLYISREQYNCCVNKSLVINNSSRLTTWRESKFKLRGYNYVK